MDNINLLHLKQRLDSIDWSGNFEQADKEHYETLDSLCEYIEVELGRNPKSETIDNALLLLAENITEISTLGEKGVYPIICRVDGEVFATNSFTFLHYDNETHTLHWEKQLTPVFTNEKVRSNFMQSLERAEGVHHKMDFSYSYPQIGSLMIKDNSIYAFVEADTVNPCRLSQFKYYWYLELTQDGIYKRKIWGKEKLERLAQKHGLRGKFSAQKEYLILSPIFKTDEWKGKQKLLRLSDLELLDITLPRGYSKFRIMDIWDNHVFISDEADHIALCRMVE
nr:hypothetical protein [Treponema denticola]